MPRGIPDTMVAWCNYGSFVNLYIREARYVFIRAEAELHDLDKLASAISFCNCDTVYFSGNNAKRIHDDIDDKLRNFGLRHTLTAWGVGSLSEDVEEFFYISNQNPSLRVFIVCGGDEIRTLKEALEVVFSLISIDGDW